VTFQIVCLQRPPRPPSLGAPELGVRRPVYEDRHVPRRAGNVHLSLSLPPSHSLSPSLPHTHSLSSLSLSLFRSLLSLSLSRSLNVSMQASKYVCMYVCVCICVCDQCMKTGWYVCVYVCVCACLRVRGGVCVCMRARTCVYVFEYTYVYTHAEMNRTGCLAKTITQPCGSCSTTSPR